MGRVQPNKAQEKYQLIRIRTILTTVLKVMTWLRGHSLKVTVSNQAKATLYSNTQELVSTTLLGPDSQELRQLNRNMAEITQP